MQQQPGLLSHKEETLQARLVGMAQLLGAASLEEGAGLCRREPGLLVFTTEDLQNRWEWPAVRNRKFSISCECDLEETYCNL